jgi:hypothetical protein
MVDLPHAMQFRGEKNIAATLASARKYAGENGRVATLPDLISAKVAGVKRMDLWFTTTTAIYYGLSKKGNSVIIVAHDIGPLTDLRVLKEAYTTHALTSPNHTTYGTISAGKFESLESGDYGKVEIIDATPYLERKYNAEKKALKWDIEFFLGQESDPLLRALLGKDGEAYLLSVISSVERSRLVGGSRHALFTVGTTCGIVPTNYSANLLILSGMSFPRVTLQEPHQANFVAVRDKKPIKKIHEEVRLSDMAQEIKEVQSKFDKLRNQLDLLITMEDQGLL